jgi:hypothetical protein
LSRLYAILSRPGKSDIESVIDDHSNDPLTPPFAVAVVLVAAGILLVNRPR